MSNKKSSGDGSGGSFRTDTGSVQGHASSMISVTLDTSTSAVSISYTTIGDINTGAADNGDSYIYAGDTKTDVSTYSKDIVDASVVHKNTDDTVGSSIGGQ